MRLYICSKYCPKNCTLHDASRVANHNVDQAIKVANHLIEMGHQPYVPIINHYIQIHPSAKRDYGEWWYEYDLEFLRRWAEGIVILGDPSESIGMQLEISEAKKIGVPLFKFIKKCNAIISYDSKFKYVCATCKKEVDELCHNGDCVSCCSIKQAKGREYYNE